MAKLGADAMARPYSGDLQRKLDFGSHSTLNCNKRSALIQSVVEKK
jgi:hypothetical protein